MAELPTQYSIVVVDIEGLRERTHFQQFALRAEMYEVLKSAARAASLPWDEFHTQDRADGILMLIPPVVSPVNLAGIFLTALDLCLAGRGAGVTATQGLRARVALHRGQVRLDERGWSGAAVELACQLAAAPALCHTLKAAAQAHLAFIVSEPAYQAMHGQEYRMTGAATYQPVRFDAWPPPAAEAWITVPGYAAPPVLAAAAHF